MQSDEDHKVRSLAEKVLWRRRFERLLIAVVLLLIPAGVYGLRTLDQPAQNLTVSSADPVAEQLEGSSTSTDAADENTPDDPGSGALMDPTDAADQPEAGERTYSSEGGDRTPADSRLEDPAPTPDPEPDAEPDPVLDPDPIPDPDPDPTPDPDSDPDPIPDPDPEPDPEPDPKPEPDPTPEPAPVYAAEAFTVVAAHETNVLTWNVASVGSAPASYAVERASSQDGPFSTIASVSPTTTTFIDPVTETGYLYYRVSSVDATRGVTAPTSARRNDRVVISERVGPEGMTLWAANGEVELEIPVGALDATLPIGVSELDTSPRMVGALQLASTYDLSPDGLTLGVPATLRIAYDIPVSHFQVSATLEAALELVSYDAGAGAWATVPSSLVPGEQMLEGSVPHFSYWSGASIQPHGTSPTKVSYCSGICHNLVEAPGSPDVIPKRIKEVCYNCHGNATSDLPPAGASGPNIEAEFLDSDDLTHTAGVTSRHPVDAGELKCSSCHDVHRNPDGGYTYLLKSYDAVTGRSVASKPGVPVGNAFCWTCHGTKASARVNAVVPGYWTRTGDKKTNLVGTPHETLTAPDATEISCSACHGSHGATSTALIAAGTVNGAAVTGNDQSLCLACHTGAVGAYPGEAIYTQTGHSTVTESSKAATGWASSASAAGSCQNCHDPHGSTNDAFLRETPESLCVGCHDASGLTYPVDYSYQGDAAYAASGHGALSNTLSWTTLRSDSSGFGAWEGITAPTPAAPGVALSAAEIDALRTIDGDRAVTNGTDVTGESDYQVYRFHVETDPATLSSLTVRWAGFGELLAGFPTSVSVWNETLAAGAGDWEQLATGDWASLTEIKSTLSTPVDYVDASGDVYLMARAVSAIDAEILTGPMASRVTSRTVNITWTTRGLANSWVDFGPTTSYGTTTGSAALSAAHSVVISVEPTGTYHYQVHSDDSEGETDTSADAFFGMPAPVLVDLALVGWSPGPVPVTFDWSLEPSPRTPYTFQFVVWGSGYNYTSEWMSATSRELDLPFGSFNWRVIAKDSNGDLSAWSRTDSFATFDSGSCPFLFTWDGSEYAFEADLFGAGKLATKTSRGYLTPDPVDPYVVRTVPSVIDGSWEFRLVEERIETDYLDVLKFYTADVPAGYRVFGEKPEMGTPSGTLPTMLHTVAETPGAPVSATHVQTGDDISALIAADDEDRLILSADRNTDFGYQTLELDLGDIADAEQVKIVMDAMSMFPTTEEGAARAATFGPRTKLEVQDADGNWVTANRAAATLPKPPEFSRPYVFDISDIWISDSRRVRFTFLFKTYVDWIAVDTTTDIPVALTEVPRESAILQPHGFDPKVGDSDVYEYEYGDGDSSSAHLPGAYTRFGEVGQLLDSRDDCFVIYGGGDELVLRFTPPADAPADVNRALIMYTDGYYKDIKVDVEHTVEPLPFHAMSNFPYGADEHYPDDAVHNAYRAEWNTRIEGVVEAPATEASEPAKASGPVGIAKDILGRVGDFFGDLFSSDASSEADDSRFLTRHNAPVTTVETIASIPEDVHRSLHAEYVALEVTVDGVASAPGDCSVCHDVHGSPDENGVVRTGLVADREDIVCTSAGNGGCHSSAANSVSDVNVYEQFTTPGNNTRHHDVTEAAQDATGASIRCSDCHNPHSDSEDLRFANPETPGLAYERAITPYIGPAGEVYAAVGARHDALPPVISGHWIDLNTLGASQPIIRWTTNENATSWIEYGLTASYGSLDGVDTLSLTHGVTLNSVVAGNEYHYRIRTTDALGNTAYSADATFVAVDPPPAPVLASEPDTVAIWELAIPLNWSAVTCPDGDPVEYYVDVWSGANHYPSGWISATGWTTPLLPAGLQYTWRVLARDAVHTYATSVWSTQDIFYLAGTGSCPFLYSWDGDSFGWEADLYTTGKIASQRAGGTYKKPNPNDYYVLDRDLVPLDGAFEMRLVEERIETDYLDTFNLYAIDLPADRSIAAEKIPQGGIYEPIEDIVHTVSSTMSAPLSAFVVETGEDVLAKISTTDEEYAILSPDQELPGYQSIELDLGDLSDAPAIKLLFEGMSRFPKTPEGKELGTAGVRQKVEVVDANGEWIALEGSWPKPAEFARPYLLDLTGLFPTDDYRVRLTFLLKTYVNSVKLDTTADEAFPVTQIPLTSAELRRHGGNGRSSEGDVYEYVYEEPAAHVEFEGYFPGAYTRFGDVTPLLEQSDDKFVIYGAGDEIALRFEVLPEPEPGMERHYVVFANGYYKDMNTDVPKTVEPLPFGAMSNYPYGADENYPDDADHNAYQAEWNTRVMGAAGETGLTSSESTAALASAVDTQAAAESSGPVDAIRGFLREVSALLADLFTADGTTSETANASPSDRTSAQFLTTHTAPTDLAQHYSVNTDAWIVALTDGGRSRISTTPVSGWESIGTATPPTLGTPGTPVLAAELAKLATVDATRWITDLAVTDGAYNWQLVEFAVASDEARAAREIAIEWTGYGEPTTGNPTSVYLWNFDTSGWELVSSALMGSNRFVARIAQDPDDDYCLTCHDGAPTEGVVFPSSVYNVGPRWSGSGWAADLHGDSAGTGFGGGMRSGYERGSSGMPCGACHESHGNGNDYHIASQVNGVDVTITNGNSYKTLCAACHTGTVLNWHQECITCHAWGLGHGNSVDSPETNTNVGYPNATSDCSLCHNHGSRSNVGSVDDIGVDDPTCSEHYCHSYGNTF